jgi:hypothetical protein
MKLAIAMVVLLIAAVGLTTLLGEDNTSETKTLDNGQLPAVPNQPETTPGAIENERTLSRIGNGAELVSVSNPIANQTINSPASIKGRAPGYWFFEATAPVSVVNWDGLIIGEGFVTAEGDWMTTELVPFDGQVSFESSDDTPSNWGWVILRRQNASGLPENDAAVEIPVFLSN